jgi:hypothetical protein
VISFWLGQHSSHILQAELHNRRAHAIERSISFPSLRGKFINLHCEHSACHSFANYMPIVLPARVCSILVIASTIHLVSGSFAEKMLSSQRHQIGCRGRSHAIPAAFLRIIAA